MASNETGISVESTRSKTAELPAQEIRGEAVKSVHDRIIFYPPYGTLIKVRMPSSLDDNWKAGRVSQWLHFGKNKNGIRIRFKDGQECDRPWPHRDLKIDVHRMQPCGESDKTMSKSKTSVAVITDCIDTHSTIFGDAMISSSSEKDNTSAVSGTWNAESLVDTQNKINTITTSDHLFDLFLQAPEGSNNAQFRDTDEINIFDSPFFGLEDDDDIDEDIQAFLASPHVHEESVQSSTSAPPHDSIALTSCSSLVSSFMGGAGSSRRNELPQRISLQVTVNECGIVDPCLPQRQPRECSSSSRGNVDVLKYGERTREDEEEGGVSSHVHEIVHEAADTDESAGDEVQELLAAASALTADPKRIEAYFQRMKTRGVTARVFPPEPTGRSRKGAGLGKTGTWMKVCG